MIAIVSAIIPVFLTGLAGVIWKQSNWQATQNDNMRQIFRRLGRIERHLGIEENGSDVTK